MVRILHTADLHLGQRLYGRRREPEQAQVLDWIVGIAGEQAVDALVLCGDIFDTASPSTQAQELYYRFLHSLRSTGCRHVVVLAGNHDSPSFLAAPAPLLRAMDVHVVTSPELVVLQDASGRPQALVEAVPYLRERDVREAMPGASLEEKAAAWRRGIAAAYAALDVQAQAMGLDVPRIALGHVLVAGSQAHEGEGMRLSIGGLDAVPASVFPACQYVALGHIHRAQWVGDGRRIRYSGAPLALGFGDAGASKTVEVVDLHHDGTYDVTSLTVPCFQELLRVHGPLAAVEARLAHEARRGTALWVEVEVAEALPAEEIRRRIDAVTAGSPVEVLCVRVPRCAATALTAQTGERLEDLTPMEVFCRCLEISGVEEEARPALLQAFGELERWVMEEGSGEGGVCRSDA